MSHYTAPLWYRLCHLKQDHTTQTSANLSQNAYIETLKSDLIALLSQLQRNLHPDQNSLINYGLTDLSHFNPQSNSDREYIRQAIQQTIERFEPRLQQVVVTLVDTATDSQDCISCKILGTVALIPQQKVICFDSTITTADGKISLEVDDEK
jgi:type VI secretion system lysozyme-like protein